MEHLQGGDILTRISDGSKWKFLHYKPIDTSKSTVRAKGGFDRTAFKQAAEQAFDHQFSYELSWSETFLYANVMDKGSEAERLAMRQAVK